MVNAVLTPSTPALDPALELDEEDDEFASALLLFREDALCPFSNPFPDCSSYT